MVKRKLRITAEAIAAVRKAAEAAGQDECMGVLAGRAGTDLVTEAMVLPAEASACHAEAEPLGIARTLAAIAERGLVPKGIFHSHACLGVFHSGTDEATIRRLFPQMATQDFRRPKPGTLAPTIESDRAVVPLPDGRCLEVTLLGQRIPETNAHERVSWGKGEISFEPDAVGADVGITDQGSRLRVASGGVVMTLPVPEDATLTISKVDRALYRIAHVYSLVVNRAGGAEARCLAVYALNGERIVREAACELEVVGDAQAPSREGKRAPAAGRPSEGNTDGQV